ncbi:MAG: filamentous hemagglutinin N-terminal domain-containing protein, partial [Pseudomonadota bacterium]
MKKKITYKNTAQQPVFHRVCALVLVITTTCSPSLSFAAGLFPGLTGRTTVTPLLPTATQLEFLKSTGATYDKNTMTITQGQDRDIIDWSKFNIASGDTVRFYQGTGTPGTDNWKPNSNYAILNRIYDTSPSVINGRLQADGRVYMINRNGVFFGPDSKVQVQSLVASTFNIADEHFKDGRLIFDSIPYDPNQTSRVSDDAAISNEGDITTHSGGSVFFVGPNVQNLGEISASGGKIDLVGLKADGQVEIKEILQTRFEPNDVIYSDITKAGDVANMAGGSLHGDDGGWIGLYGSTVRNDGLIRAVTTRRQNGVVYLSARDLVATGQGSVTDVDVTESAEAMGRNALAFNPGDVTFSGLVQKGAGETAAPISTALARIDHEGSITAHSGNVTMEAVERVFLGEKSNIDVSGLSIERSMEDQFIEAQLNSLYLRDDYGQKQGSLLPGSTVTVDVLEGSSIGNLSSYYLGMPKNARDLSTVGGNISIGALDRVIPGSSFKYTLGDIIISKGAGFDISGGKVTYSGIAPASTKLIGSDGRVYDISNAPQWATYTGMVGSTTKSYGKFGSETLKGISFGGQLISLKSKPDDRVVGGSAGSLSLSSKVILGLNDDLNLRAAVTTGLNQTVTTSHLESDKSKAEDSPEYQRYQDYLISMNRGLEAPTGGRLSIGTTLSTGLSSENAVKDNAVVNSVEVKKSVTAATQGLSWDDRELLDGASSTGISADMISRLNLGALEINANTTIKTDHDAGITLRPGGSYIARGRRIEFLGSVITAGGTVEMTTRPNITSFETIGGGNNPLYNGDLRETIFLGDQSRISTAGEQIDNSTLGLSTLEMRKGGFTSGGSISLLQLSEAGVDGGVLTRNN